MNVSLPSGVGEYHGFAGDSTKQLTKRYLTALNRRDGRALCRSLAPWMSGLYDLAAKQEQAKGNTLGKAGCPAIGAFIGFGGENVETKFRRFEIETVETRAEGGLVRAEVTGRLSVVPTNGGAPRTRPFRDTVWLVRSNGSWPIATPSVVGREAGLGVPGGPADDRDNDIRGKPNVDEDRRRFRAELERYLRYERDRKASYRQAQAPARCPGGVRISDPARDATDYVHPAPNTPLPRQDGADLRRARVSRTGSEICLEMTMNGPIEGPLKATFNVRDSAAGTGFIQVFDVEVRADGAVRVTSGNDNDHRAISVPAEVGVGGRRLSLVVGERSFSAGRPAPLSRTTKPPRRQFVFGVSSEAGAGNTRVAHDDLGPGQPARYFSYPSGSECGFGTRGC